jgi:non-canonical (house-cleaning) NTP pyrophosphatase
LKWGGDAILARRLSFGAASPERITILVSKPTEQGPISERTLDISILKKAVGLVMVKTDQSVTDYSD